MDYRSLTNVLAILRYINAQSSRNPTTAQILSELAHETKMVASSSTVLRLAAEISEQAEQAKLVIANSQIPDEAKFGVQASLDRVVSAFSLEGINKFVRDSFGDVGATISNLVILLSVTGTRTDIDVPAEATTLAEEVEDLMRSFKGADLDPVMLEIAKQHLQILATMLRHLPIFGFEAAMATYFELMLKVRASDERGTASQRAAAKPLMERASSLMEGLNKTESAWTSGAKLIGHARTAAVLFGLLPPS